MNSLLYQTRQNTFLIYNKASLHLYYVQQSKNKEKKKKQLHIKSEVNAIETHGFWFFFSGRAMRIKYIYGIHQHKFYTARCAHAHRQFRFASILFQVYASTTTH